MSYGQTTKRLLDILLLLAVLPFALPVLLILLVVGAFTFDGKPMFTQVRPGKGTEAFLLLKLRSMRDLKDGSGHQLPVEQRLTPYGRWLRRSSLDELPQLLNILQGDMSFIGPRPLLQEYLPFYTAEELRRHDVLPGITGYAQIAGRNAVGWEEKLKRDVYYAENQSIKLDLYIIKTTFRILFSRERSFYEPPERLDVYRARKDLNQDLQDS